MAQNPMTTVGKKLLDVELERLVKTEREEIKASISEARAHGDLKENAEYHAAKEKQAHNEGRIGEIQSRLNSAQVIDISKIDQERIVFGATVTIFNEEKEVSRTFQIVGEDEAQTAEDKISYNSPLGKALIGKDEGDEVVVKAPKGDVIYVVEGFEYK